MTGLQLSATRGQPSPANWCFPPCLNGKTQYLNSLACKTCKLCSWPNSPEEDGTMFLPWISKDSQCAFSIPEKGLALWATKTSESPKYSLGQDAGWEGRRTGLGQNRAIKWHQVAVGASEPTAQAAAKGVPGIPECEPKAGTRRGRMGWDDLGELWWQLSVPSSHGGSQHHFLCKVRWHLPTDVTQTSDDKHH